MNIFQLEPANQRTKDWRIERLGCFTGSEIAKLMKASRTKGEVFGDTAKDYIYCKMAERDLSSRTIGVTDIWEQYLDLTSVTNKAMRFGTDNEADARSEYEKQTGEVVYETASIAHPDIANFSASPDGVISNENGTIIGCLEIKVPQPTTFMKYRCEVSDGPSLKKVNDTYFYQCQAEMMVTGAEWTDFCVYNPFLNHTLHIARIYRDEEAISQITERISLAEEFIKSHK